jgi:glycosyltransferase involved in cell wall biosynthesis
MSDDGSDEIYKKYNKVDVRKWSNNNEINELKYLEIKNNAYKATSMDCDWVIVCDCDEFLYHPNLIEKLEEYKEKNVTVPKIDGHDMFSETFPEYDGAPITDKIKTGSESYKPMSKNIIFNPKIDVKFGIGAHSFQTSSGTYSKNAEIMLLHYKFLSKEYVLNRYDMMAKRLSEFNKKHGFGGHYTRPPMDYMDKMLKDQYKVI